MACVNCPQCGTERVVVEGKRKNCRKCGTRLTANVAKVKPQVKKAGKAATGDSSSAAQE